MRAADRETPEFSPDPSLARFSGLDRVAFILLWIFVFSMPWEKLVMIRGVFSIARAIGILVLGASFLAIVDAGRLRVPGPGHILLAVFSLWAGLSYAWTASAESTTFVFVAYAQLFAMAWIIWQFAWREREQRQLMQAYVLGAWVSALSTIARYLSHKQTFYERYATAGFDANDLGLMLAVSLPFSYYLILQTRGAMVWAYRTQLVLASTAILLTASRGAVLASLVALLMAPLTLGRLTREQKIANGLIAAALICGAVLFVPASSWRRISTTTTELTEGTLNSRTVIWQAGLEVFGRHPFLGVGAGAYAEGVEPLLGYAREGQFVAHNTFLSVLVENGVIGFGVFCAFLLIVGRCVVELSGLQRVLWVISLTIWTIGASSLTLEHQKVTWFLFGLLLAQWKTANRRRSKAQHRSFLSARVSTTFP